MKKKTRCYIYTRVSTAIQVDGYSLDAQKDETVVALHHQRPTVGSQNNPISGGQ